MYIYVLTLFEIMFSDSVDSWETIVLFVLHLFF